MKPPKPTNTGFHRRSQTNKKLRAKITIRVVFFQSPSTYIEAPAALFTWSFVRRNAWLIANAGADWKDAYTV
jgi:hypothetical protein